MYFKYNIHKYEMKILSYLILVQQELEFVISSYQNLSRQKPIKSKLFFKTKIILTLPCNTVNPFNSIREKCYFKHLKIYIFKH